MYIFTFNDNLQVESTFNHTWYIVDRGWITAEQINENDEVYRNYLFAPMKEDELQENIRTTNFKIHPKLLEFYKKYNGVSLSFDAINIYMDIIQ